MMKKIYALLLYFFILSGCAGSSGYFLDRGRDAADILTFTAGFGVGAKIRVGPFQTGLLFDQGIAGLRGGQFVVNSTEPTTLSSMDYDIQYIISSFEFFRSCTGKSCERKKDYSTSHFFNGAPFFYLVDNDRLYYYTNIEAVIDIGPGIRVGFNPGELIDFVLGWTTIDIYNDDYNAGNHLIVTQSEKPSPCSP